jgi:hypothetical protein
MGGITDIITSIIPPSTRSLCRRRYYGGGYRGGGMYNDSNFVFVDAHVLGSPVLADVNNDGHVEVLVAVSYYFDKEEYEGKEVDFDPSMYVAGGIACWDLQVHTPLYSPYIAPIWPSSSPYLNGPGGIACWDLQVTPLYSPYLALT